MKTTKVSPQNKSQSSSQNASSTTACTTTAKKPFVVVVRRPKKRKRLSTQNNNNNNNNHHNKSKPGLPNFTKELTQPPPPDDHDNNNNDDEEDEFAFAPMDDTIIPCDTLLVFYSLTQAPHLSLTIPLQASMEPIAAVLETQLYPILQHSQHDHDALATLTHELQDLLHPQHVLRRLSSIASSNSSSAVTVLLLTREYQRGVWDAHDAAEMSSTMEREVQQIYVEWFLRHLHRWTGRFITTLQFQQTWARHPPAVEALSYKYNVVVSFTQALEYLQHLQVLMASTSTSTSSSSSSSSDTRYQLWLPQWGATLAALNTAQKKLVQKLHQTHQKELSEKSFLQQPYYHSISSRLLLQWMQDLEMVQLVPKPYGNFIKLRVASKQSTKKQRIK